MYSVQACNKAPPIFQNKVSREIIFSYLDTIQLLPWRIAMAMKEPLWSDFSWGNYYAQAEKEMNPRILSITTNFFARNSIGPFQNPLTLILQERFDLKDNLLDFFLITLSQKGFNPHFNVESSLFEKCLERFIYSPTSFGPDSRAVVIAFVKKIDFARIDQNIITAILKKIVFFDNCFLLANFAVNPTFSPNCSTFVLERYEEITRPVSGASNYTLRAFNMLALQMDLQVRNKNHRSP